MREGGVPAPCTRLQHLGDSEVLLEQKRQSNTLGLPRPRRRDRNGPHRELVRPRYHLPEPEGDRVLRNLLRATSCGDEQPVTSRMMCSSAVQATPDCLHRTEQSPIVMCARVWQGWYSKALKLRSRGGGVLRLRYKTCNEGEGHLTPDPGARDMM